MDMVFIIESPNGKDLFDGRKEGDTLSKALSLSKIKFRYFLVVNKEMLELAFEEIISEVLNSENPLTLLPYIHLSAHGNENGFELTNGVFLEWADFGNLLIKLNKDIGYVDLSPKLRISKVVLCMSVCEGFNIGKIMELRPKPFQAIVGNISAIYWEDALMAFLIFYHNAIGKSLSTKEAVLRMNLGSGVDSKFELQVDNEILNNDRHHNSEN